jgi:hypothetical protein
MAEGPAALSVASAIDAMADASHIDDDHGMGHAPSDDEELPEEETPGHHSEDEPMDEEEEEENAAAARLRASS